MSLKIIVEGILKRKTRSMSWLAGQMDKSADGFRLSLMRGSIKFIDLKKMASILDVPIERFFMEDPQKYDKSKSASRLSEPENEYTDLKTSLVTAEEVLKQMRELEAATKARKMARKR